MKEYEKLPSKKFSNVILRVVPGHFVTPNSHVNYFMDMAAIMRRQSEAKAAAEALAQYYSVGTVIDTIVCLDGMDIIGAYLANELTKAGILSKNAHKTMYILQPEHDVNGQMIFRQNIEGWIRDKNCLLLLSSASTGATISKAAQTINYYGGKVVGISALFSIVTKIDGYPVYSLFDSSDIPDYRSYKYNECPMCKAQQKVYAIVNGYGYSKL